jgi:hypothetical protein
MQGVSMGYSFEDAKAAERRETVRRVISDWRGIRELHSPPTCSAAARKTAVI